MKRLLDAVLGSFAAVIAAPAMVAIAVAIRVVDGAPVIFRQRRSGVGGRPFDLVKFRTMRAADGPEWDPSSDGDRTTRLGRTLRATSLDELPTLVHVVTGRMSLVGPRPLPVEYLSRYSNRQARRLEVRPGITGWAQVHGLRGNTPIEIRTLYDLYYVENWSVALDLRILLMTVIHVLRGENAY